jgi:LacI family transcriptional regulator, galactose operon repressor
MAAKLKDVARVAGVSPATVSQVLNQRTRSIRISDATCERVLQAARQLDYSPNQAARALRLHKTYSAGIVSFDVNDPMAAARASHIDRQLAAHGYRIMTADAHHDDRLAMQLVRHFLTSRVDGIVLLASSYRPDIVELREIRTRHSLPIACVGRDLSQAGIQSFAVDYQAGARCAAELLLQSGYRRIAVIVGSDVYEPDSSDRLEGARQACQAYGVEIAPELIVREREGGWHPQMGYCNMQQLLTLDPVPEAVLAFDDVTAYGAIRAIFEAGRRVPDDIAVIGFDDLAVSAFYNPPLTTVRQPVQEESAAVADYLIRAMEGQADESPGCRMFDAQLIVRKSAPRGS